jgi:hypothetical protein
VHDHTRYDISCPYRVVQATENRDRFAVS